MPFFISVEEANRRLNHKDNLFVKHSELGSGNHNNHGAAGRKEGSENRSKEIKALIGLLAKSDGVGKVSTALGIAPSLVSHYKNGKTQDKDGVKPDQELRKEIRKEEEFKAEQLRSLVRSRIERIIEGITEEKIDEADLPKASKAAANLASVYKNFQGSSPAPVSGNQFVFFGVPSKSEQEYETLEAEVVSRS